MGRDCEGRRALVTGASRGIGAAIAQRLAAEGAAVAVVARTADPGDSPLPGSLVEVVAAIEAGGGHAVALTADLAERGADHGRLVAAAADELGGGIDILVNNAAACWHLPFERVSPSRMEVAWEVNVRAPWLLTAAALPAMRAAGEGWVLDISSGSADLPAGPPFTPTATGGSCIYGGTKAMTDRVVVGLALELQGSGVRANALRPTAAVATEGATAMMDLEQMGVLLEPLETMAEAALALCSAADDSLNGLVTDSLGLLARLDRPVRDLTGNDDVPDWQPPDIRRLLARRGRPGDAA